MPMYTRLFDACFISKFQDKVTYEGAIAKDQDIRATLLDTRGPEIRSGKLKNDQSGHETISLVQGSTITLRTDQTFEQEGSVRTYDTMMEYIL